MVPPACKAVEENDTQFLFFSNHLSLYPVVFTQTMEYFISPPLGHDITLLDDL